MKTKMVVLLIAPALVFVGCSEIENTAVGDGSSAQVSSNSVENPAVPPAKEPPPPVVTNANSVVVDDEGRGEYIMGAIRYRLGENGTFTGRAGRPEPAGPVIVYIFRAIPAEFQQQLTVAGITAKENSAYLYPESSPYNAESMKRSQFLRTIDPTLSNEALAAEFGLNISAPAP